MTEEGKRFASTGEVANARRALVAAYALLAIGDPRTAVTQVYYAVFHAMRAMLYSIGIEPATHKGTQTMFGLHFIKTGGFDAGLAKLGSELQKAREKADYAPTFEITAEAVTADLTVVRAFVADVASSLGQ